MKNKKFSDVFGEIYSNNHKKLEELRIIALFKCIFLYVIAIIYAFYILKYTAKYLEDLSIPLAMLGLIVAFYLNKFVVKEYAKEFKFNVIKILVESQNDTYEYRPKFGITEMEYSESDLERNWDEFESEDYIEGNLDKNVTFKMAQVDTYDVTKEAYGKSRKTIFSGLYGIITLPVKTEGTLTINGNSAAREYLESRINLESQVFEENYDVLSEDKIWALQVLNSEVIENLIELKNKISTPIKIKISGDKIFFRLEYKDLFEPPKFFNSVGFETLYKYFRTINIPVYLYDAFADNLIDISKKKEIENVDNSLNKDNKTELLENDEEIYFTTNKTDDDE